MKTKITRYIIGLLLLVFLIFWIVKTIQELKEFKVFHGFSMNFIQVLKSMFYSNNIIKHIMLLLAILGFFILRPLGWILISNLFYFYAFQWIFITLLAYSEHWYN